MSDRERVVETARRVAGGGMLASLSSDTRTQPLLCAQFVRQVVEGALGLGEGGWPVATRARTIADRAGRGTRRSLDYEQAARDLGLTHTGPPRPGDVLYWPYGEFGHTALFLGEVSGVACIVENTNAGRGTPVWPGSPVRLTPLDRTPPPTTVAAVSAAALEDAPAPLDPAGPESPYARALYDHLPRPRRQQFRRLLGLGDNDGRLTQTVWMLGRFCERGALPLTDAGVAAFKRGRGLGGPTHGPEAIDEATAQAYWGALTLLKLLLITGAFEGEHGFTNVAGSFDGQGVSFGVLQWNFGQGTLAPLLLGMEARDPGAFAAIFGADTAQVRAALVGPPAAQAAFAAGLQGSGGQLQPRWKDRFVRLGLHAPYQDVQLEAAGTRLEAAKGLAREYGLVTERGLALMFDIITQNGGIAARTREAIQGAEAAERARLGRLLGEIERLGLIARERAAAASPRWQGDVLARKLTIVQGRGTVHGTRWDLGSQFGLGDAAWA
ncbi:hypothetical protein [Deinococcus planocerae]|uniref:hypothetical protein n=1 Tax=Deinococcus planocerae TaxID=1737569 RepID=UPI000C7ECEA4|nr:hypothetical protein [Deinococcus planocerae]